MAQTLSADPPTGRWWRDFGSSALDQDVDLALQDNPDLAASRANLTAASELLKAQKTSLWPQAALSYSASRSYTAASLASPLSGNAPANPFWLHTGQLSLSYTPDLWGGQGALIQLSSSEESLASWQLTAARNLVIANVLNAALAKAALSDQLEDMDRVVAASREMLADMQAQRRSGAVAQSDVDPYISQLAQDEQARDSIRRGLHVSDLLLRQLLGRGPDGATGVSLAFDQVRAPGRLPFLMPADLVARRPDVAEARANLSAACANAKIADAARLPLLNLTALGGGAGSRLADLVNRSDRFWDLSLGLTMPLVEQASLAHQARAARAQLDAARASYRSSVIHALDDAAQTLDALDEDARLVQSALDIEISASESASNLAHAQATGGSGRFQWLGAQRSSDLASAALCAARLQRLEDTVGLYIAMGGAPVKSDA